MKRTCQNLFFTFLLAVFFIVAACSTVAVKGKPGSLIIQEQGSFAVGGTVVTSPGTFDPVIYYGDYIPEQRSTNPGQDQWRVRLKMARLWRDALNARGGDVTVVHLPEIGIRGNTHFPFSDLNNLEIADLMSNFLEKKGLH